MIKLLGLARYPYETPNVVETLAFLAVVVVFLRIYLRDRWRVVA